MNFWLARAFREWLAGECAMMPLLIVLEDVHWGDLPSIQYISEALRTTTPLMVLAISRPDAQGDAADPVRVHGPAPPGSAHAPHICYRLDPVYFLLHSPIMGARSVQISLDEKLLARIDKQPAVRKKGRSAFIRAAVEAYLTAGRARAIDEAYDQAYGRKGASEIAFAEFSPLIDGQAWPED